MLASGRTNLVRVSAALMLMGALALSGCGKSEPHEPPLEVLFPAPKFTLTNQNGQPFGSEQLAGKTWIATLFFTQCKGPCPMMANRLQRIQDSLKDPNVLIVSVSCDPKNDTVERLKEYADAHHADSKRWFFLTGDAKAASDVAAGLHLAFETGPTPELIGHDTKFLLVDGRGQVRGVYHSDDDTSMINLRADAARLAKSN